MEIKNSACRTSLWLLNRPVSGSLQSLPVQLHLTQRHRAFIGPDPEPCIQRLCEVGGEGVEVDQGVLRDAVERQSSCRPVQVNGDSVGEGFRRGGAEPAVVVARRVASLRALQAPRPLVVSQQAAQRISSGDAIVRHADVGTAPPLHLPVHRVQQPLSAQDLRAALKPVRVVRGQMV